jgi:hypothetical protein
VRLHRRPAPAVWRSEAATRTWSFIVRLWQEGDAPSPRPGAWRGQITRVDSEECVRTGHVDDVPVLLACQMDRSGIRLGWAWRLCLRLYVWRQRWMRWMPWRW